MTTVPPLTNAVLSPLQARLDYLEERDRWHRSALDLLLSLREVHNDAHFNRNPAVILQGSREHIGRLGDWHGTAFLTVNEEDSGFVLFDCQPVGQWEWVQQEVDAFIESGEFAWAINQNRAVILRAHHRDCDLVLHVLTTKTRIRGMFIGHPAQPLSALPEGVLQLLSIVLHHTAYVLESAELYRLLAEEKEALEEAVAQRTAELQYQYTHDLLTGLPNRLVLLDRLSQAVRRADRRAERVAVLIVDIDAFKLVNDSLGRASGDQLLTLLARRIGDHLHMLDGAGRPALEEATVCRLGVDEFCVLLPAVETVDEIANTSQRLKALVAEPFVVAGQNIYLTAGVGISVYPDDGGDAEGLLAQADVAMHHAKAKGRNVHQFYAPRMNAHALTHLTVAAELRMALEQQEFVLFYQPQVDTRSGRVSGVEALIRWRRADGTLVPPMEFIPILEEDCTLIIPVGEWVLREAGRMALRLRAAGHPDIKVAVNLSAVQFSDQALASRIAVILEEEGVPAAAMELELTESTIMEDVQHAVDSLRALVALGLCVAVDDFGTGYSSLSHLKRFPIHTLKVDRSFVRDTPGDSEDTAIVHAIIALAHSLNLSVVAEGVETAEQVTLLRELGCECIQGFYYSRPLPEPELLAYLARQGMAGQG